MARRKMPCAEPGCPTPVPAGARGGRCAQHRRERRLRRGTLAEQGYRSTVHDTPLGRMTYDECRRAYAAADQRTCWRCGVAIVGTFHLGHDDLDRSVIRGPEHPECNLSAAGRARWGGGGGETVGPPQRW